MENCRKEEIVGIQFNVIYVLERGQKVLVSKFNIYIKIMNKVIKKYFLQYYKEGDKNIYNYNFQSMTKDFCAR